MAAATDPRIADMDEQIELPRKNGELVFDALWEGRAFGMAAALNEQGTYAWREFRDQLVDEITAADAKGDESSYYERFLAAFEKLAIARGLVTTKELDERTEEYASGARSDFEEDDDHHDHAH